MKRIVRKAIVERPGDVGMDLPAGATAQQLTATDYHPVDMEAPEAKAPRKRRLVKKVARGRRISARA
jgi:hypothetical protein